MAKEYTLIGGNGTKVSPLEVTEDGTYEAGDSRAFNPVKVNTGGGGGSSTLSGLTDVDISNPSNGQTLVYDATAQKWVNGSGGSGGGLTVLEGTYAESGSSATVTLSVTCSELYAMCQSGVVGVEYTQHTVYGPGDEEDATCLELVEVCTIYIGTETGTSYGFKLSTEMRANGEANDLVVFSQDK